MSRSLLALALAACLSRSESEPPPPPAAMEAMPAEAMDDGLLILRGSGGERERKEEGGAGQRAQAAAPARSRPKPSPSPAGPAAPAPEPAQAEVAVREWFPEAFLWRPLVETDANGQARVDVRVPDQLTTWRVLGLAHDRAGQQTGAEHAFQSALPAYVDPVVPGWMFVGDAVSLPIQVVDAAGRGVSGTLRAEGRDALAGSLAESVSVGPYGSAVLTLPVVAERAGAAGLSASLTGVDAVERSWPVQPVGRPVVEQRGGTLSGARSLELTWPAGADPRTAELTVEVFPGPLAVLVAELERLGSGASRGAYAYGLAGHLEQLGEATGARVDPAALRALRVRAWQRVVREARAPDAGGAADLLLGLRGVDDPLVVALRERLERVLLDGQRGDGTWARQPTDTLQRVLVQTAVATRALPEDAAGARLRAQGAVERNQPLVDDPYTAAVLLATGPGRREPLREAVLAALVESNGQRTVAVPSGVSSPWTRLPPLRAEVLAWTALALLPTDPEVAGELVSELMTGYSAERGFGAGPADALALEAVVAALPTIDRPIALQLVSGGRALARGAVDPAQPRVPAILRVPRSALSGDAVELSSEPGSAGLAWVLTQRAWVPWTGTESLPGVDVAVRQGPLRAGSPGRLDVELAAPSGAVVRVVQGLPPGVAVDVDRLRAQRGVAQAEVLPDRVELTTTPFGAGEVLSIAIPVQPTYAGRMVSRPLEIEVAGRAVLTAPHRWEVQR